MMRHFICNSGIFSCLVSETVSRRERPRKSEISFTSVGNVDDVRGTQQRAQVLPISAHHRLRGVSLGLDHSPAKLPRLLLLRRMSLLLLPKLSAHARCPASQGRQLERRSLLLPA